MEKLEDLRERVPEWSSMIRIENGKVVYVNWEGDFRLFELSNEKNENIRNTAYKNRKSLYQFLEMRRIIVSNSKISNNRTLYCVYKSKVRGNIDYKVGPSLDGKIYYFTSSEMARDWANAFAKRNNGWYVFAYKV